MNAFGSRQVYLHFLQELLTCGQELYSLGYDNKFHLLYDNSPDNRQFQLLFAFHDFWEQLLNLAGEAILPVIMTDSLGMMWVADFEAEDLDSGLRIHVVGPALMEFLPASALDEKLKREKLSPDVKRQIRETVEILPVLPVTRLCQVAMMLHYTLTEEKISMGDIRYLSETPKSGKTIEPPRRNVRGAWAREQEILRHVAEGSTEIGRNRDRLSLSARVGKLSAGDAIRQMKNQTIIFTALCMRAAIRGGLSPDTAYELSDRYILEIEGCTQIAEIIETGKAMEDDFTRRVRRAKEARGVSPQIQRCCDYILMNLNRKISVSELAELAGFARNYFIVKFREETGKTVSDYIRMEKMERAKDLLRASNDSIQDIAEKLGYATQSHFGKRFREYAGCTPKEYREKTENDFFTA